jgi:hypothetical protein
VAGDPAEHDIRQHVEPGHQVKLLEDHRRARPPGSEVRAAQRRDINAAIGNAPCGGVDEAIDRPEQRRLTRTRTADDADERTLLKFERHRLNRDGFAEPAGQTVESQHGAPRILPLSHP